MKLAFLVLCATALVASSSCASDGEIRLSIRGATPEQRAEITEAPAVWNAVARERFRFDDADPEVLIVVRDLSAERASTPDLAGYWDGRTVHVEQAFEGDTLQMIVSHELGHVLGIGHIDDNVPGLMNPHAGQLELSPADIAECRRVEACG